MTRDSITTPPAVVIDAEADALATFVAIEARVDRAEHDSILARWEFGRRLLAERDRHGGKQLPHGRLAEVCAAIGKSPAEVRTRMQFAAEYATRDEVATAVATFKSWTEIRDRLGRRGQGRPPEVEPLEVLEDRIRIGMTEVAEIVAAAPQSIKDEMRALLPATLAKLDERPIDLTWPLWARFFPSPNVVAQFDAEVMWAMAVATTTAILDGLERVGR